MDYRGEICVLLVNHSDTPYDVKPGERIAQIVFRRVATPELVQVAQIDAATARGGSGFGSTGTGALSI